MFVPRSCANATSRIFYRTAFLSATRPRIVPQNAKLLRIRVRHRMDPHAAHFRIAAGAVSNTATASQWSAFGHWRIQAWADQGGGAASPH